MRLNSAMKIIMSAMCEGCILGKQKKKGQFRETGQSTKARKTGAGSLISVNYFGSY
jgi:hypothetical protein